MRPPALIAASAIVQDGVTIGGGSRVGEFCFIRSSTVIGTDTTVGSYVGIEGDVSIGDGVSIQSGCHITRGVVIEDLVFLGPRVVTMNDRALTHARPSMPVEKAAPRVGRGARIGGGSLLLPGACVGANALVLAGSVVAASVPDGAIVAGNPTRIVGQVPAVERV
jgi:acetyltransferase-like isoleucine patch superfamily enzyme